jgi:hypothetical protein
MAPQDWMDWSDWFAAIGSVPRRLPGKGRDFDRFWKIPPCH